MDYVYIIYTADAWHSNASKQAVAVFTDGATALAAAQKEYDIDDYQMENLTNIGQTQGLEQNIMIELTQLDTFF